MEEDVGEFLRVQGGWVTRLWVVPGEVAGVGQGEGVVAGQAVGECGGDVGRGEVAEVGVRNEPADRGAVNSKGRGADGLPSPGAEKKPGCRDGDGSAPEEDREVSFGEPQLDGRSCRAVHQSRDVLRQFQSPVGDRAGTFAWHVAFVAEAELEDARVVLPGGCCDFCAVALVTRVLGPHCGAECR